MRKVIKGLIVVAGLWIGVELFTEGSSGAFGGAFADLFGSGTAELDNRSTAQRAGDSVARAQAEAEARRERMLPD